MTISADDVLFYASRQLCDVHCFDNEHYRAVCIARPGRRSVLGLQDNELVAELSCKNRCRCRLVAAKQAGIEEKTEGRRSVARLTLYHWHTDSLS